MNCSECRSDGTIQCIACLRARLRETAQILIEAVGADGPMDAEDAARQAAAQLEALLNPDRCPHGSRRITSCEDCLIRERDRDLTPGMQAMFDRERGVAADQRAPSMGRPEIGADLTPLLVKGNTVIVIRMPPIDLPPHEYVEVMRKVRTDTLAWLDRERIRHSGVLILAPGWEVSTVPREDLRALLDGDPVARVDRAADRLEQACAAYSIPEAYMMRGEWEQFYRAEAQAILAAADGVGTYAPESAGPARWVASRMVTIHYLGRVARFAVNGRFVALPHTVFEGDTIWATGVPEADAILAGAFGDSGEGL